MTKAADLVKDEAYQFGFHDDIRPEFTTGRGLNEQVVRAISREKHEPQWMLNYRLKAYEIYRKMPLPAFGPDLSQLNLDEMTYYQKYTKKKYRDWDDVPVEIKQTFDRLGVPQAERKYLAGSSR